MDDFERAFRSAQRGQTFRTIIWAAVVLAGLFVAFQVLT